MIGAQGLLLHFIQTTFCQRIWKYLKKFNGHASKEDREISQFWAVMDILIAAARVEQRRAANQQTNVPSNSDEHTNAATEQNTATNPQTNVPSHSDRHTNTAVP